jgi:hypothetical protein
LSLSSVPEKRTSESESSMPSSFLIDTSVAARKLPSECRWTRGVGAEGPYALGGTASDDAS